jgi:hypothetical protein
MRWKKRIYILSMAFSEFLDTSNQMQRIML